MIDYLISSIVIGVIVAVVMWSRPYQKLLRKIGAADLFLNCVKCMSFWWAIILLYLIWGTWEVILFAGVSSMSAIIAEKELWRA